MMWNSVSIPGKPRILVVDASNNLGAWEWEFCNRLYASLKRRKLGLVGTAPVRAERPEDLTPHLGATDAGNCILLFCQGSDELVPPEASMRSYWAWLNSCAGQVPKLFAACTWEGYDPVVSQEILGSSESFAPLALAQQSPLTPREAGLYFMKFFTELELHSEDSITGKMVWFSGSKARELLRRRRLPGKFGVRC